MTKLTITFIILGIGLSMVGIFWLFNNVSFKKKEKYSPISKEHKQFFKV